MGSGKQECFFVSCPRGLENPLSAELSELGITGITVAPGGVSCAGSFTLSYRINLESRLASRVLWRVGETPYQSEQDIYEAVVHTPWVEWFSPRHTIKVMTSARRCPLRSLEYVTLRIKDAVCDHFRERARRRPSVETARPDIRIAAFLDEHRATFYLDTSGEALFKRGWRQMTGEAPLRENLAAGLLRLAQWTPGQPLLDPMCGSGTILLEAVQWARGVAPGLGRTFAVERLRAFDRVAWQSAVAAAEARQHARPSDVRLFGSDRDPVSLQAARANLQAVGALQAVRLDTQDVVNIKPPATSGIIVTNPPYGVRTGHADDLAAFYPNLGDVLKQRFAGWRAYVFTADQRLPGLIGLKPSRRIPLFNGSLECRLYEFAVVSGQYRKQERTG